MSQPMSVYTDSKGLVHHSDESLLVPELFFLFSLFLFVDVLLLLLK